MIRRSYCQYYDAGTCAVNIFSKDISKMIKSNQIIICQRCSQISCIHHHQQIEYKHGVFMCKWCQGNKQ